MSETGTSMIYKCSSGDKLYVAAKQTPEQVSAIQKMAEEYKEFNSTSGSGRVTAGQNTIIVFPGIVKAYAT